MAHINLLPWRETLRKQRQKEFGISAGVTVLFAGLVMVLVHMQIEAMISYQNSRNQFLEREIAAMEKKIEEIEKLEKVKSQLLARMNIIQQLQESRPLVVHLFDELVKTVPEGVVLESVAQANDIVTIQGVAESNTRVSAFMRNVEASEWVESPDLEVISGGAKGRTEDGVPSQFTLRLAVKFMGQQEEDQDGGGGKKSRRKGGRK